MQEKASTLISADDYGCDESAEKKPSTKEYFWMKKGPDWKL